jgi:hypothetical protein
MQIVRPAIIAVAFATSTFLGAAQAMAASTFYGIVDHVSVDNIKVHNPKTHQDMSFLLTPKFDQIFSADGKTTYQMKKIHAGSYVGVIYDQKALGARHADKIYVLNNANEKITAQ